VSTPEVRVFCAVCGDELYDPYVEVEDGTIIVTVSGVCEREHRQALEQAGWEHRQALQRQQEQADRRLRDQRQHHETQTFLRDEQDRKEKERRGFRRLLGR